MLVRESNECREIWRDRETISFGYINASFPISTNKENSTMTLHRQYLLAMVVCVFLNGCAPTADLDYAKLPLAELTRLAEKGDANAQRNLGLKYSNGIDVAKDDAQAVAWIRKAAEQGNALAQATFGWFYMNGLGMPKDEQQAAAWYRKAAEQGNALAQALLSVMYYKGTGVPKDEQQAVSWCRKAAEQGNADAQAFLGAMYGDGTGVPKDEQQAAAWYRKAAEQGLASAQNALGVMYEDGIGVPKDAVLAYALFNLATAQSNENSLENRGRAERMLSPKQREEGQALSTRWKVGTPFPTRSETGGESAAKSTSATEQKSCRPNTQSIRCSSQCYNGNCVVSYENGCKIRVQVQAKYDPFTSQWEYPSPSC